MHYKNIFFIIRLKRKNNMRFGDLGNLFQQMQKAQQDIKKIQEELRKKKCGR